MKINTQPSLILALILALAPLIGAQSVPATPAAPTAPTAPTVSGPATSNTTGTTANPASTGMYGGTWVVERAIYDYLSTLRDVTGKDGAYFQRLVFGPNNGGTILYRGETSDQAMEYEFRDTGLTIAYGSRLKPLTDLYQVLLLDDGRLWLKSRRLGQMNGTMVYLLRRE